MYLIVASQVDDAAGDLIQYFPNGEAKILTPADLSQPGWRINTVKPSESVFVANGEKFYSADLEGVLCLLPCIFEKELVQIVEEARDYVASEMTAFLKYWLSSLPCPVLNPPTAGCLSGPNWRREQWLQAALDVGIKVMPFNRGTRIQCPSDKIEEQLLKVTLIGKKELGENKSGLSVQVGILAEAVGVNLLEAYFMKSKRNNNYLFYNANTFPSLRGAKTAQLIMEFFKGG